MVSKKGIFDVFQCSNQTILFKQVPVFPKNGLFFQKSRNSSAGRASDWRSEGHVFDPRFRHFFFFFFSFFFEIESVLCFWCSNSKKSFFFSNQLFGVHLPLNQNGDCSWFFGKNIKKKKEKEQRKQLHTRNNRTHQKKKRNWKKISLAGNRTRGGRVKADRVTDYTTRELVEKKQKRTVVLWWVVFVLLSLQRTTEYPLIFELLRKNWEITFSWCWWPARVNKKKARILGNGVNPKTGTCENSTSVTFPVLSNDDLLIISTSSHITSSSPKNIHLQATPTL